LLKQNPANVRKKGCETTLFLIDILHYKKSQRPCWCQWLEGGDKRPKKQPKNKYINLSLVKPLNVFWAKQKKTDTMAGTLWKSTLLLYQRGQNNAIAGN
jgi:hypothetical protein